MENITPAQRAALDNLGRRPGFRVDWDEPRGVAAVIRGAELGWLDEDGDPVGALGPARILFSPLPSDDAPVLVPSDRDVRDDLGWRHAGYQQVVPTQSGTLELHRSVLTVHVRPGGDISSVESSCYRDVMVAKFDEFSPLALQQRLAAAIAVAINAKELAAANKDEPGFPMMTTPELIIYPRGAGFRPAYRLEAFGMRGDDSGKPQLAELGKTIIDAETGERLLFAPTDRSQQRTPAIGSGLSVTPLAGGFQRRDLHISADPQTGTYYLEDRTLARPIITYNAGNDAQFNTYLLRRDALFRGEMPISGNESERWDRVLSGGTLDARTRSQQPEVDLHFHMRAAFEWYSRLVGRAGWDDGAYSEPLPIIGIAHVFDRWDKTASHMRRQRKQGRLIMWIEFPDQDGKIYTYSSGSRFIVAHEYQHAVNDFAFRSGPGSLGLDSSDDNWHGAFDEGIADLFGGYLAGDWRPCRDISPVRRILRNLAFPRDTAAEDPSNLDHFGDRAVTGYRHARGTILAHAAYLMDAGGVHQRPGRNPNRIAVRGLGTETYKGAEVRKAARIWYRTLIHHFAHLGAATGEAAQDEQLFPSFAQACIDTAADLYGEESTEHRTAKRAFYAVGLFASAGEYGADVGFLPPSVDWADSVPYVGLAGSPWASRDLVVVGSADEKTIFCRVRNFGDAPATDLEVTFDYAELSTAGENWRPAVVAGRPLVLHIGRLDAGASSFPDEAQENPPAAASIRWRLPTDPDGRVGHHFCLRATVTSRGAVLDQVRSAAVHLADTPDGHTVTVLAGNPTDTMIEARIAAASDMAGGWKATVSGNAGMKLVPGERRPFDIRLVPPAVDPAAPADPPLGGEVIGRFGEPMAGDFRGVLADATATRQSPPGVWRVQGRLAATMTGSINVHGEFHGTVDSTTGKLAGTLTGSGDRPGDARGVAVRMEVDAQLRPCREVRVTQTVGGRVVGGVMLRLDGAAIDDRR
ncbi:M4 family metallopeptidase [Actinoplanes aureus]|uniref:M4 family metallopeptidase n=1 Tax=Actinoplanes aureus TaxID=2792083 RepID=A0A931G2Q6_9ACTN|nr:M4 family metallopeptidase [Actinoplanes aureus]MBG0568425.1 M4 family metallopeptidase [Actinoplanes aureus]